MEMDIEREEVVGAVGFIAALTLVLILPFVFGCGGGSKIPVGGCDSANPHPDCPTECIDFVTDECIPELEEELCEVCEEPKVVQCCYKLWNGRLQAVKCGTTKHIHPKPECAEFE